MDPIRVLYVNGGIMDLGGISMYMMNYYRHMDRSKVQIDFVVHGFERGVFDDEIREMGGKIYNVPVKSKNLLGNIKALRKILKSGQYKIVHSHMDAMSTLVLMEAKMAGIPVRIAHSHSTDHLTKNKVKYLLNEIARNQIKRYATHLLACSEAAGRWLFGDEAVQSGRVKVIKNAIDVSRYKFNAEKRNKLREELNCQNNFVVGHVGGFNYQKNHIFLLEVFAKLVKKLPNAKLVLVGDGHLRDQINNKIVELGLRNHVILLGYQSHVNDLLNAFDIFVLPSLFEGLPVSAIEAQANGLRCYLSDTISKEVAVTNKIKFISIKNEDEWVEHIIRDYQLEKGLNRTINEAEFINAGYDITVAARNLCDLYISLAEGSRK